MLNNQGLDPRIMDHLVPRRGGLPAHFIETSRRTSVYCSELTAGRSVESLAKTRHASQSLAVLR